MLTASVVIPTYNRPRDLHACIESILSQKRLPLEIVVVDDGNLEELPLKAEAEAAGVGYVYHRKKKRGLTASRNAGIAVSSGQIVFFLDDDVVLYPDYVDRILRVFEEDEGRAIGGAGGLIENIPPLTLRDRLRRLYEAFFLITGSREGRVLPSGFYVDFGQTGNPIVRREDVDFLSGGVSAYRREVFASHSFDETHYLKYGYGEDKDFSHGVQRGWRLVLEPRARLDHNESPVMREDHYSYGRMFLTNHYLFFRRYVRRGPLSWLPFYYALFGYFTARLAAGLVFPSKSKFQFIRGMLTAVKENWRRDEIVVG